MAKALGSIRVRLAGNGQSGTTPASVEFLYQVLMDGVPAHRGLHGVAAPDWTKTLAQFVTDEVAAIKAAEGIA